MFHYFPPLSILIFVLLGLFSVQSIPNDWQSSMNLSSPGSLFSPVDHPALFLSNITISSLLFCARLCHFNGQCRIFDYDPQSRQCRLFQGDIITMGSIIPSSSSQSRAGSMKIDGSQFTARGQACSSCQGSRYLQCENNVCQCPLSTFFDGSICRSEKLLGDQCSNNNECRADLNYICLPGMQCGLIPMQSGTTIGGYSNGTASSSLNALRSPRGVTLDRNGSIYVADHDNHRVIKLQEGSLFGSIVAGTGTSGSGLTQLKGPGNVHVDASSNMYIADSDNYRVMLWRKNASTGILVAGTGLQGNTSNTFNLPYGIVVDARENIYVSDIYNHRVVKWAPNATSGVAIAGNGIAGNGDQELSKPFGLFLDEHNGHLYIADSGNHRIQRYSLNETSNGTTVAGGNGRGSGNHQLDNPTDIFLVNRTGSIYIADFGNERILKWILGSTSGINIVGIPGLTGSNATLLDGPTGFVASHNETYFYVTDRKNNRIQRFQLF